MPQTSIIRPDGLDVDSANWTASVGTKFACVSDQLDGTFITPNLALDPITFTLGAPTVAGNVGIERLIVKCRVSGDNFVEIGLRARFNSVNMNQLRANITAETSPQTIEVSLDITFLRPGGGQWTVDDIGNLNIGIHEANWFSLKPDILELWVEYSYAEVPLQLPAAREVPSRILRRRRTTRENIAGQVPPEFLDLELLQNFGAVHSDAATEDGQGYALAKWKRGLYRLTAVELDMNAPIGDGFTVTLEGDGLRHYAINLWDAAHARTAGPLQDGAALLDGGQVRTFDRASVVHVPDPSDGRIVAVQFDNEAITTYGRLIETEAKNYLPRSSFRDGATGYTDINDANVSKTTVLYEDWDETVLFDPKVTRYYTLYEILNNAATGSRQWPTSDAFLAGTNIYLSIDFRYDVADGVSGPGVWALQRAVDSWWWNDGSQAWQAGVIANPLGGTSPVVVKRRSEFPIPIGTSATTVDLHVGMLAGETVGSKMRVYHAQLEAGSVGGVSDGRSWASSRIVTGASTFARQPAFLSYTNLEANRMWGATRGTVTVKIRSEWYDTVLAANNFKTVAFMYHNANNYMWLYYDKNNTRWVFEVAVAGAFFLAVKAASVAPTATVALAARWTSGEGELGLSPYTASVFVGGVKGTDVVVGSAMGELDVNDAGSAGVHIGTKAGIFWLDGSFADLEIFPFVLSDIEIARLAL